MYQINHQRTSQVLELQNPENGCHAKIYLGQGASLQELTLSGKQLIVDLAPLKYADTYASSILFPFANRIKDGQYQFEGTNYQLETNQKEENNALHGLVYNKTFEIVESTSSTNEAYVSLKYIEDTKTIGFPFTYEISVSYRFTNDSLTLGVIVKNTDIKPFPFTLGWHPYFLSANLFESSLVFKSDEKFVLGDRNITTGSEPFNHEGSFQIQDKSLDDCWNLDSNAIGFHTPDYRFVIESSDVNNFLQVYTPPKENTIAIEPTTGISNSFNNQIGLKTLNPGETYRIDWNLKLTDN